MILCWVHFQLSYQINVVGHANAYAMKSCICESAIHTFLKCCPEGTRRRHEQNRYCQQTFCINCVTACLQGAEHWCHFIWRLSSKRCCKLRADNVFKFCPGPVRTQSFWHLPIWWIDTNNYLKFLQAHSWTQNLARPLWCLFHMLLAKRRRVQHTSLGLTFGMHSSIDQSPVQERASFRLLVSLQPYVCQQWYIVQWIGQWFWCYTLR